MSIQQGFRRVVFTGGPGAGKTALLTELERRGYRVVAEVARAIISERKQKGLPPRPGPLEFAKEILESDVKQYESSAPAKSDLIFFDRGIFDSLGMMDQANALTRLEQQRYLETYPYHPSVFIFPPWREIYQMDAQRDQSYGEAVQVPDWLRHWYARCGYNLIEVPPGSIGERCTFVLQELGESPNDA